MTAEEEAAAERKEVTLRILCAMIQNGDHRPATDAPRDRHGYGCDLRSVRVVQDAREVADNFLKPVGD